MKIAEIYESIQGEGWLTGKQSVFVRASGCNLRCRFCDTPFTSWEPQGNDLAVDDIVDQVLATGTQHVVLTGGEPMLFAELIPLCTALHNAGRHITIETAGTLHLQLKCDLMSISPKLSNSAPDPDSFPAWHRRHEATRHQPSVIIDLLRDYQCQFKFVVESVDDVREVQNWFAEIDSHAQGRVTLKRDQILLMPEGVELDRLKAIESWLEPLAQRHGFQYCPRRQIEWFGNRRQT